MTGLQSAVAAIAAVVLFIYALQGFSREVQAVGGTALQSWLGRVTESRWRGFAVGVLATAVVQSSSAVTSLTAALVDGSIISFRASLGVLLGSNVGTTVTAWLVSLKLTAVGPFLIVFGALLSALPNHANLAGKSVFYFGLILFALELVSAELNPLRDQPAFVDLMAMAHVPWKGVFIGVVFTALVQSSSVTTGVAILLVLQGTLPAEAAIPVVVGANVGSTSTALLASIGMNTVARATAKANFLFNLAGATCLFPFLRQFSLAMTGLVQDPALAVAWAHLVFNVSLALALLFPLNLLAPRLQSLLLGVRN